MQRIKICSFVLLSKKNAVCSVVKKNKKLCDTLCPLF